ncbi:MazG family protein [Gordonia sp. DT30]|uniref:MazG family protein n=1 Tax=Gordonia sp. DT30 TaxID=3416546 RepID=UPI003CFB6E88
MTVVLLDPLRPDLIPVRARAHLSGTVYVTEDVPTGVLWDLDHFQPVFTVDEIAGTLLAADAQHPLVRARIAQGEEVIAPTIPSGNDLLAAVALMDTLRRTGPWESRQTHESLRRYLIEEVYEFLDAIERGDQTELRGELGDLLLQVLFHARIAADDPTEPFDIDGVARSFTDKVSGRTPGVLSGAHADLETQIREWEEHKAAELHRGSVLDGIATGAPALALTQKVLERLTAAGYPVERIDPQVLSITVTAGDDSTEDRARRRTIALMSQVRAAEEQAARVGLTLDGPAAWTAILDGTAVPEDVEASTVTAADEEADTEEAGAGDSDPEDPGAGEPGAGESAVEVTDELPIVESDVAVDDAAGPGAPSGTASPDLGAEGDVIDVEVVETVVEGPTDG